MMAIFLFGQLKFELVSLDKNALFQEKGGEREREREGKGRVKRGQKITYCCSPCILRIEFMVAFSDNFIKMLESKALQPRQRIKIPYH